MRSSTLATRRCSRSASPARSVELFPGAGHLFFWEQPDRFVAAVEEFLL